MPNATRSIALSAILLLCATTAQAFDARLETSASDELKAQLTSPVAWHESMRYLLAQGANTFVEVGPGSVLLGLMKRIDRKAKRVPVKFEE